MFSEEKSCRMVVKCDSICRNLEQIQNTMIIARKLGLGMKTKWT